MPLNRLHLFLFFHLNLLYSSIEEDQRPAVIRDCYGPLLDLLERGSVPAAVEVPGVTLEILADLAPSWIERLRRLIGQGRCELIGSGYTQLIGPLVPAPVNRANFALGHEVYEKILGIRPTVALVNEQAYSRGMVPHYLDAGCQALVMDWNNPFRTHPEWDPEWRYLPQRAVDAAGVRTIPVLWNNSIVFQKFQRYAHGEMDREEYLRYLGQHAGERERILCLYGNDAEIFDFRPGRYHTEAAPQDESEWRRIGDVLEHIAAGGGGRFLLPAEALRFLGEEGAGNALDLSSPEDPIPVKKQVKYNINRWGITGRDDLGVNTACWRIYERLRREPSRDPALWKELCYLWSSDFRTHITDRRWNAFRDRLAALEERTGAGGLRARGAPPARPAAADRPLRTSVARTGRFLTVEAPSIRLVLNPARGLAVDSLAFREAGSRPLCGTLAHGYYDDIRYGADFYTGHVVLETPGQPRITDLGPVEPEWEILEDGAVRIWGRVATPLGEVAKEITVVPAEGRVDFAFELRWPLLPIGSLRIGAVTFHPEAFDPSSLYYATHNGGDAAETFPLAGHCVRHGDAASFLVSATQGLGITEGTVVLGDRERRLTASVDREQAAVLGQVTFVPVGESYFLRLVFSAREMDETSRPLALPQPLRFRLSLRGERAIHIAEEGKSP
jgi:hypothetical protein